MFPFDDVVSFFKSDFCGGHSVSHHGAVRASPLTAPFKWFFMVRAFFSLEASFGIGNSKGICAEAKSMVCRFRRLGTETWVVMGFDVVRVCPFV